ncbi:3096_t:CDS:2, partial [Racocetra fulgida]
ESILELNDLEAEKEDKESAEAKEYEAKHIRVYRRQNLARSANWNKKLIDVCESIDNEEDNSWLFGSEIRKIICKEAKIAKNNNSTCEYIAEQVKDSVNLEVQETFPIITLRDLFRIIKNKEKKELDQRGSTRAKALKILEKLAENNKGSMITKYNNKRSGLGSKISPGSYILQKKEKERRSSTDYESDRGIQIEKGDSRSKECESDLIEIESVRDKTEKRKEKSNEREIYQTYQVSERSLTESRIHDEQEEMLNNALQTIEVVRVHNRYGVNENKVTERENKESIERNQILIEIEPDIDKETGISFELLNAITEAVLLVKLKYRNLIIDLNRALKSAENIRLLDDARIERIDKHKRVESDCISNQNKRQKIDELNNKKNRCILANMRQINSICELPLEINPESSSSSEEAVNKKINSDNTEMTISTVVYRSIINIHQKANNLESQNEPLYLSKNTIEYDEPVEIGSYRMKDRRQEKTMTVIGKDLRVGATASLNLLKAYQIVISTTRKDLKLSECDKIKRILKVKQDLDDTLKDNILCAEK